MNRWGILLGAAVLVGSVSGAAEAKTKLKFGTLAPEGTPWHKGLLKMASRFKKASKGEVRMKIYPGGIAGDEGGMLRKMRIGQLHGAALTTVGLSQVTRSTLALQIPMLIDSYAELDALRAHLGPQIEAELERAGFVVLNWGDAGWLQFFAQTEVSSPADMVGKKFFVWAGDPEAEKAFRAAGMTPVPMSATDVLVGLQTGLIESFASTPLYALSTQWFGLAKHMVKVDWSPLNGATIVKKEKWEKISPPLRAELKKIALEVGQDTLKEVRRLDDEALAAMKARGLKVRELSPPEREAFRVAAQKVYPMMRGTVIPEKFFDSALQKAAKK